ncbi:hypothetical protein BESB_065300 [Besnoitia besnoiti]|uniref:Uncharacterized protein n=1 Tax=Besnoitia besnoiti TaxID=94643 RepID=A0A2A9M7N8_BESBE|nr:hypothetical protein BESB_065300 [Besnoitia besnoiti]PFH34498.1 hypothetical protein BESB_065300 [Besnoitia besnoiti]
MADAQSKNGVPAVPLVNETRRDRRHSLPVLARPSEDCVLARSSRGDIRLLVHHAASPGDRSPSNTSCSLDEQGSFLLPSVATEAESRCRLIKQMSGTLAFTLVAAFALLTAIFVLAGR